MTTSGLSRPGGSVDLALLKIEGHSNKVFPTVALGSPLNGRVNVSLLSEVPSGWKEAYPRA